MATGKVNQGRTIELAEEIRRRPGTSSIFIKMKFKKKSRIEQMGEKIPSDIIFITTISASTFYHPKVE